MPEDYGTPPNEISIRDYLDLLRRRKAVIIQTLVVVIVAGTVLTLLSKPAYQANARILINTHNGFEANQIDPGIGLGTFLNGAMSDDVATQIEVLQSTKMLSDAYTQAGITPGAARISVRPVQNTSVIEIVADSGDPIAAEKLAKTMPDTYLNNVKTSRTLQLTRAESFVKERRKEVEEKLDIAELRLQNFRQSKKVVDGAEQRKEDIKLQAELEKNVRVAQSEVAATQAKLDQLKVEKSKTPKQIVTPVETSNTIVIQGLDDQITKLRSERQGLLVKYPPSTPIVVQVDERIAELVRTKAKTPQTITSLTKAPNPFIEKLNEKISETNVDLIEKKEQMARAQASLAKSDVSTWGGLERIESGYKRDVEQYRTMLVGLTETGEKLSMQIKGSPDPGMVIQPAGKAVQVAPRTANNIVFAGIIGLVLGICFALLQEYMDDRINTPDDARKILEAPILSYVPMVESSDSRLLSRSNGGGTLLESYRVMRANVQFASIDGPSDSIVITSTSPGEGKSVTASNLAVAMAMDGRRVIIVDADLRRPSLHEKFGLDQRPGLTNVLVGHTTLEDALKETGVPGLRILTAGPLPPNPAELLNSNAMRAIHQELRELAEVVIFDSPPFLATADAQVLAAMADGIIYVIQFGEAKKSAVRHAVDLIHQARARVLGVVFNKIDLSSRRDDYYYGYNRYYTYYHSPQLESGDRQPRKIANEFEDLLKSGNGASVSDDTAVASIMEDREVEKTV